MTASGEFTYENPLVISTTATHSSHTLPLSPTNNQGTTPYDNFVPPVTADYDNPGMDAVFSNAVVFPPVENSVEEVQ